MKANVRANLGVVDTGETAVEETRSAASQVIQAPQERYGVTRARAHSGREVVTTGGVHSPFMLHDRHRKIVEEASKKAVAKAAHHADKEARKISKELRAAHRSTARERHRCRRYTEKVYHGGTAWTGCPCDAFWV